jgi:hypothetical protein
LHKSSLSLFSPPLRPLRPLRLKKIQNYPA